MINYYVRYFYGETPHGSLQRRTPYEVFSAARITTERQIEVSKLNFLMMAMERKNIRSEGIRLDKKIYWHRELVNHVGQSCIIRYDYSDARWIVVYDKNDVFICQAALRKTQHPFIEVSMDKAVSHKELNKEYKEIKGLRREKEQSAKRWVLNSSKAVDKLLKPASVEISTQNHEIEDKRKTSIFTSPSMLEAPSKDSDEIIEEMTRKAMLRLPKHPDMLSTEEQEKRDNERKERLVREEIERIIDQEIKESFDRIGLDYQGSNADTPISWKTAFSKTAREYYKSTDQDSNGDVGILISTASVQETDANKPASEQADNSEPIEDTNTLTHAELLTDNQQQQTDVDKESKPFAHLSRKEYLKRIGIIN